MERDWDLGLDRDLEFEFESRFERLGVELSGRRDAFRFRLDFRAAARLPEWM